MKLPRKLKKAWKKEGFVVGFDRAYGTSVGITALFAIVDEALYLVDVKES